MSTSEQDILQGLINGWIPLGLEYAQGAQGVTTLYLYADSEPNHQHANIFFEQSGRVVYPSRLDGVDSHSQRILNMQKCMIEDLIEAERLFREIGIPCPTEYRITYEPEAGRLDVQLSRDIKYADHPVKTLQSGPEDWLDGRLEKVVGKLLPPEREWFRFAKKRK
ncbi:hypothetical protein [Clavibacter sp. VKM Ac-2872]|uniref:hypothetical protein n=1 Tax=Clavibacter sp. VKM Ac-2872 TaxID=2783812 RepID=UPI00188CE7B9|nr:hypothetical protein [Clavibacter sp. VKM Ac-2872]MBF4624022.1 hypothetical protein [Clavibacter sp. VKM Ac-2872]